MSSNSPPQRITPVNITDSQDIPKDAVLLTEKEAWKLQWDMISGWKPRSDVWPFTLGVGFLGVAAGFSGYLANNHYRKSLNLLHHGKISSYVPLVIIPTLLDGFLHHRLVSHDIVLYKKVCPVCMESRAMVLQAMCGVIYPLIITPATTFHLASRLLTYPIPPLSKELWRTYSQLTKPLLPQILFMFGINLGAAMLIALEEVKAVHRISKKIDEMYESVF